MIRLQRPWQRLRASAPSWPSYEPGPLTPTITRLNESLILRDDRWRAWIVTLTLGLLAFALRLVNLGRPRNLMFDEIYYAKDAWTLLNLGYESEWPEGSDEAILHGDVMGFTTDPSFIVHPQLGKWLIAAGEYAFGMNSFGWRISACIAGAILVMATIRLARRLSRSTLIGALAGFLLILDGLAFVMSRIALLDIFQATFAVLAVAAVVADRDWLRVRLARYLADKQIPNLGGSFGPLLWWRPWRWVAGLMFGLSIACKWNTLYLLAAMGILSVVLDLHTRLMAGADRRALRTLVTEAPLAFIAMVVTAAGVYVASWWSWLRGTGGWGRDWGAKHPDDWWVRHVGEALGSLVHYHHDIYNFHVGEWMTQQTHVYEAHPGTWLVMGRVIGIDAVNDIQPGEDGCTAAAGDTCIRVVSGAGTPLLWWFGAISLLVGLVLWLAGRDMRFAIPLIAGLTTWIMWFPNADRPLFFFYAIMIIPFTCIVLAMVLGLMLGPPDHPRRARRAVIVGAIVMLILVNFWFIYPILTDELMTRQAWSWRMWFRSWI